MSSIETLVDEIQLARYLEVDKKVSEILLEEGIISSLSEYSRTNLDSLQRKILHKGYKLDVQYHKLPRGAMEVKVFLSKVVATKVLKFESPFNNTIAYDGTA